MIKASQELAAKRQQEEDEADNEEAKEMQLAVERSK